MLEGVVSPNTYIKFTAGQNKCKIEGVCMHQIRFGQKSSTY